MKSITLILILILSVFELYIFYDFCLTKVVFDEFGQIYNKRRA